MSQTLDDLKAIDTQLEADVVAVKAKIDELKGQAGTSDAELQPIVDSLKKVSQDLEAAIA